MRNKRKYCDFIDRKRKGGKSTRAEKENEKEKKRKGKNNKKKRITVAQMVAGSVILLTVADVQV